MPRWSEWLYSAPYWKVCPLITADLAGAEAISRSAFQLWDLITATKTALRHASLPLVGQNVPFSSNASVSVNSALDDANTIKAPCKSTPDLSWLNSH